MNNFDFVSLRSMAVRVVSFATTVCSHHAMALFNGE